MAVANDITQLIGATDLVQLNNIVPEDSADVFVKIESRNPGGSVKDRIGLAMILAAEKSGMLKPGGTIVEPTSGNTGIALSLVAATRGYSCILTMPDTMSIERQLLLKQYGAEVILTPGSEGMKGSIARAQKIVEDTDGSYMAQQFENPANPEVHRLTTGPEIWSDTNGKIDAFVCGVGTGGTISGVADALKKRKPALKIIAVEPAESPVLSGGQHSPHKIQGIGAGFIPKNLNVELLDGIQQVSSLQAFEMKSRLTKEEGILAGISSGASVFAALKIAEELGKGKVVVTVIHDTGERYLSMENTV
mgnify:CR=1 FL=1